MGLVRLAVYHSIRRCIHMTWRIGSPGLGNCKVDFFVFQVELPYHGRVCSWVRVGS